MPLPKSGPVVLAVSSLLSLAACAKTPEAVLPKLNVDADRVMVAGLSSGAYMATQLHVALSDRIHGAALVAGGPYGCAGGDLKTALSACMKGEPVIDVAALATRARERAADGKIAALAHLAGDPVLVLHGSKDETVAASVSRAAATFYESLRDADLALAGLTVTWDGDRPFPHLFPTSSGERSCETSAEPYVGNCGFDAAGSIFTALYGSAPQVAPATAGGKLLPFAQGTYAPAGSKTELADEGRVYVPAACADGQPCGVLVALHGCQQNIDNVGDAFVSETGFNRWADAYGVVVLYPQTRASLAPLNPKACWDWWGYTGAGYDTRDGAQVAWFANVLDALKR